MRPLHWHRWRQVFPALFGTGGYADCACGARDVIGSDRYAPWAWGWVHYGVAPPPRRSDVYRVRI